MGALGGIIDQGAGGVGGIVGSFFSRSAAKKAEAAKIAALNALEEQNIEKLQGTTTKYDRESYLGRLGLLKDADPNARAAYDSAGQTYAEVASDKGGNRAKSQMAADAAYAETVGGQQGLTDAEKLSADQSAELLAQKGTLSPEMQAEMVRSGFAVGGGIGGVAGSTAMRSGMARQLASDQLAIQAKREAMSKGLSDQSQTIRANRNTLLNNISLQQQQQQANAINVGSAANTFAGSRMPTSYGLTGHDAGDVDMQNTNLRNQRRLGIAGAKVEGINGRLAATNQMIGGVANTAAAGGKAAAIAGTGGAGALAM